MPKDAESVSGKSAYSTAAEKASTGEALVANAGHVFPPSPQRWSRWGPPTVPVELKPIGNAPRDGTKIRGFRQVDGTWVSFECAWQSGVKGAPGGRWMTDAGTQEHPTHFQPGFFGDK